MLDAVGPQFPGNIGWRPVNAPSGQSLSFSGYPDAGTSFASVTIASDGRTISIGNATSSGISRQAMAIQGITHAVSWLYFWNRPTGWYISEATNATQVLYLDRADPALSGGLGWQPVYQSSFPGYDAAGTTFTSVNLGAGRKSTRFGSATSTTTDHTFRLQVFPLPNRSAYDVTINSVFDHSMVVTHAVDGVVTAYTGETGLSQFGSDLYAAEVAGQSHLIVSGALADVGYKNSAGTAFKVNGHYSGDLYLYYDGHAGVDFRTIDQAINGQVNALAAASGTVRIVVGSQFNTIIIDHGNGWSTHYLHLSKRLVVEGAQVRAGDIIGITGAAGTNAPHLHFEVQRYGIPVDPYGWSGAGQDPYTRAANRLLW
jgi:hypothetical protein